MKLPDFWVESVNDSPETVRLVPAPVSSRSEPESVGTDLPLIVTSRAPGACNSIERVIAGRGVWRSIDPVSREENRISSVPA